jgi:SAM-dependent methyltransferase
MRETIKTVVRRLLKLPAQRVADHWATDHKINRPRSWLDHPVILRYVHERVTGDASVNGVQWFQRKYLPGPVDVALSLGCGLGPFERDAIRMKIAERLFAVDISPGAIETARRAAAAAGMSDRISYAVLDLNSDALPRATYDMVFGPRFSARPRFRTNSPLPQTGRITLHRRIHWTASVPDAATCDGDHQSGIGDFAAVLPQESVH